MWEESFLLLLPYYLSLKHCDSTIIDVPVVNLSIDCVYPGESESNFC